MCPGPSRTTRRQRNRTRPPPAHEPRPRPGRPGMTPPARRRRLSRHPGPGTAPRHQDPVPAARPRPNGGRSRAPTARPRPDRGTSRVPTARPRPDGETSRVPTPAPPDRPPRLAASPASRSPCPAGRPPGPGGLASPAIHGEASRQRIQNARRRTPAASPQPGAGRPSASGCGAEGHMGADPVAAANGGRLGASSGRLPSPGNGGPSRHRGRHATWRRGVAGYPPAGSGGSSPDFS